MKVKAKNEFKYQRVDQEEQEEIKDQVMNQEKTSNDQS